MSVRLSKTHNLAWRKFLSAHAVLIEQVEQDLAKADLPPLAWYDILFAISDAPEQKLRLHELAQTVLLSRSNVTRLVDRLEKAELLRREQCDSDRRGSFAAISNKGLTMLQQMWVVYEAAIMKYFACHLDATEARLFIKLLKRMTRISASEQIQK
ncbi:MAG: MarR family transcriptional regulator [Leptolyngbya sp. SIO3F4]|nr:MarR family transcriptional regulator [Leptolyngbya sp. SIO3F4]